jgi:hypothetical protein
VRVRRVTEMNGDAQAKVVFVVWDVHSVQLVNKYAVLADEHERVVASPGRLITEEAARPIIAREPSSLVTSDGSS